MLSPFAAGVLFALPLLTAIAAAQEDAGLLGRWIGTGEANQGEKITFEKGVLVVGDQRVPYRIVEAGVLLIGGDDGDRAKYQIKGDVLQIGVGDESHAYKRDGAAPPKPEVVETPPVANPDNPLARGHQPAVDVFARLFQGDDIALELQGAAPGYRGRLVFHGKEYAAEATANGNELRGRFQVGQEWFGFTATLAGDKLTLISGGTTYQLAGAARAGSPPGGGNAMAAPPALTGVFAGNTARFEHPRGWFAFDMPAGWSVYQQSDLGMIINPGLKPTDTLDAIIGLLWGRLEPQDQNQPVAALIEKQLPKLRQALAAQGLTVGEPDAPIATFQGRDVPGAVVTFQGQAAQGKKVVVWFGGIVKRDGWIAVSGVVLVGKEDAYLPQVKRIFTSLEPRPPERNAALEGALVGHAFSNSTYGKIGNASHATYTFAGGGTVTRSLMTNVIDTPGNPGFGADAERTGRYEVCGDVLYLYFETGQESGQVLQQGAKAVGIRLGNAEYK